MGKIAANCRSAEEREFSDEFQGDLRESVSELIKDETSCETLLSYAVNEDETTIYTDVKESGRKLSFRRRRKLRGDWGKEVRSSVPILCQAGNLISQFEPGYQSEDNTADAQNAIPAPGSPVCSDSDDEECKGDKTKRPVAENRQNKETVAWERRRCGISEQTRD